MVAVSAPIQIRGGSGSISVDFEQLRTLAVALRASSASLNQLLLEATRTMANPAFVLSAPFDPLGASQVTTNTAALLAGASLSGVGYSAVADALLVAVRSYQEVDRIDAELSPLLSGVCDPGSRKAALVDLGVRMAGLNSGKSRMASELYDDGTAQLSHRPGAPTLDSAGPPGSVSDLMRGLSLRTASNAGGGAVDVRIVSRTGPDGRPIRAAIVDITGTTDWGLFQRRNPVVSGVATNLRAMGKQDTAYAQGVIAALRASGVQPNEAVMLVGHSQGGLIAAQLAVDLSRTQQYRITHLVTAGAPIGQFELPRSVQTLSLEARGDLVPELDGRLNPSRPNQITVRLDHAGGDAHSVERSYLPAAEGIDRSVDRSLTDWISSASDFLGGNTVHTDVYRVSRT